METIWNDESDHYVKKVNQIDQKIPNWVKDDQFKTINTIRLIENLSLKSGKLTYKKNGNILLPKEHNLSIISCKFSNNGETFSIGTKMNGIYLYIPKENGLNEYKTTFNASEYPLNSLEYGFGDEKIFCCGNLPFYYLLDIKSESIKKLFIQNTRGKRLEIISSIISSKSSPYLILFGKLPNQNFHLMHSTTNILISKLKIEGFPIAGKFNNDGSKFWILSDKFYITQWDLKKMAYPLTRIYDPTLIDCTSMDISPDENILAVGSKSGIVTLYNPNNGEIIKNINNLLVPISGIKFHPKGQILSFFSAKRKSEIRFFHIPEFKSFSNWPPIKNCLGNIKATEFNPIGDTLLTGNIQGIVTSWNISHYSNANREIKN